MCITAGVNNEQVVSFEVSLPVACVQCVSRPNAIESNTKGFCSSSVEVQLLYM